MLVSAYRINSNHADLTRSLVILQAAILGLLTATAMLLNSSPGGIALCVLLARLAFFYPTTVLTVWGAVYVPVTAVWTLPALSSSLAMLGAVLGFTFCGALFYGGSGFVVSRVLRRYPLLILGCSLGLAEATSAFLGLVMAPAGLFAVNGSMGYLVAWFSAIGASIVIGIMASTTALHVSFAFPIAVSVSLVLGQLPGPPPPKYDGLPIHGITHNPDPKLKWSSPAQAEEDFRRLMELSYPFAGKGLIVWPEGAVTGTFDLGEAISKLDPNHLPLLFGMTRYSKDGSSELRNSAVLVTEDGVQVTDKQWLVPIYEGAVPFVYDSDLEPGTRRILILPDGTRILPLLCYEVFLPRLWFRLRFEADLIIVLSAEAGLWARFSSSLAQRHARVRELETGVRVFRVSDR